jgi:hypothetical protein
MTFAALPVACWSFARSPEWSPEPWGRRGCSFLFAAPCRGLTGFPPFPVACGPSIRTLVRPGGALPYSKGP